MNVSCKICSSVSNKKFEGNILKKYRVRYFQCSNCGFIQTDEAFWLTEAYSSAITTLDIGLLYRNNYLQPITSAIITSYFNAERLFLDYGGGYGVFTRLMRDKGFNYYRQDIFCENLFAKNFDITDLEEYDKFEVLTAFEVFEHLKDPQEELSKILKLSDNILFSTELPPKQDFTGPDDWWYFMPETGQHISIYSERSLQHLANRNNLFFYTNGKNLHLFTKKRLNASMFKLLTRYKIARAFNYMKSRRKTLLDSDYQLMLHTLQSKPNENLI
jgi:hypothetical protein